MQFVHCRDMFEQQGIAVFDFSCTADIAGGGGYCTQPNSFSRVQLEFSRVAFVQM